MTVSLHREADTDLTAAFRHYKREVGVGVAGRFLKEFKRITKLLETNPGLGTPTGAGRPHWGLAPVIPAARFPLHGDLSGIRGRDPGSCDSPTKS